MNRLQSFLYYWYCIHAMIEERINAITGLTNKSEAFLALGY